MRLLHCALAAALAAAALAPAKTLLLLPISGETDRTSDIAAINRLFRDAVEERYTGAMSSARPAACGDRACALEAARAAKADVVIHSSLHKLGQRWIFSAAIVNADGSNPLAQRLTAQTIEDMEAITRRMADALLTRKTLEQAATVDNITQREAEHEPERRRSLYSGGISLGYMFPVGNSFSYVNHDAFGPDRRHAYDQMIRLGWLNNWEFRNNLNLGAEVMWTTPYAIGADLNLRYLFSRGDMSPFVGGGLGLHYVKSDEGPGVPSDKRNSGPALNAQGGLMLFRTYDVNVMLRGQYQVVFNTDIDHGPAIDVGVSFRPREKPQAKEERLGFWGYAGITLLALMLIGAASD